LWARLWRVSREPITRLTPSEALASIRWVQAGQARVLLLEIAARDGRNWKRVLSDRQAMAFLAAWRCPLPPPAVERLAELAGEG
jgi:hypothetical protein